MRRDTNRWVGVSALALLAAAFGIVFTRPAPLLVAGVAVAYAGYAYGTADRPPEVSVERTLSDTEPRVGDDVRVSVTVRNEGGFLPDLRVVDDVPDALEVTEGSPRLATALRHGKAATFSYSVTAKRGVHEFEAATLVSRDLAGRVEHETTAGTTTSVRCIPDLTELLEFPLRAQTARRTGRIVTGRGGSGSEFHATREYRRGDPLSRVDWTRLARTGDLATVEFREERAGSVVTVVDTRDEAYVADENGTSAVERSVQAAGGVIGALLDAGDRVGLASLGPRWLWESPGLGRDHRYQLRDHLAVADAFAPLPSGERFLADTTFRRFRKRLPGHAQVVCCSPLCDDTVLRFVRRLDAHGYPVTVVSPDPTGGDSPGDVVERVERGRRLRALRDQGIRVVDWAPDDSLPVALAAARRGWRQ